MSRSIYRKWSNIYNIDGLVYYDPPGDGSCQFLAASEGIDPVYRLSGHDLRMLAAQEVLKMDQVIFEGVIDTYCLEVKEGKFRGDWNPLSCKSKNTFALAIIKPIESGHGFDFQGDDITLSLIGNYLKVNFVTFNKDGKGRITRAQGNSDISSQFAFTVFMIRITGGTAHYQLLGIDYGDNGVQTIFKKGMIPEVFSLIGT